jgi:hypothetical protein
MGFPKYFEANTGVVSGVNTIVFWDVTTQETKWRDTSSQTRGVNRRNSQLCIGKSPVTWLLKHFPLHGNGSINKQAITR